MLLSQTESVARPTKIEPCPLKTRHNNNRTTVLDTQWTVIDSSFEYECVCTCTHSPSFRDGPVSHQIVIGWLQVALVSLTFYSHSIQLWESPHSFKVVVVIDLRCQSWDELTDTSANPHRGMFPSLFIFSTIISCSGLFVSHAHPQYSQSFPAKRSFYSGKILKLANYLFCADLIRSQTQISRCAFLKPRAKINCSRA